MFYNVTEWTVYLNSQQSVQVRYNTDVSNVLITIIFPYALF